MGSYKHIIPAIITADMIELIQKIGMSAYRELGCCGISRIDFILNPVLDPVIIEVNTLPGMTDTSLVPNAVKAAGISFPKFCSMIIEFNSKK